MLGNERFSVTTQLTLERDFPKGHPKAVDYVPGSPEAIEWARVNIHPVGQRDFPVDHVKACDSKNTDTTLEWKPGIDPRHPELEEHTGAAPKVAKARRDAYLAQLPRVKETPTLEDGRVNVAKVAEENAVKFVMEQGHEEDAARQIVREQGIDQVLAAKATLGVKGQIVREQGIDQVLAAKATLGVKG
jgi:hypothetical protein